MKKSRAKKTDLASRVKEEMLRILIRGRSETLGEACKAVGITPTTFYYRLRKAQFGAARRGRERKLSLTALDAKKLAGLLRRQARLQAALEKFSRSVRLG